MRRWYGVLFILLAAAGCTSMAPVDSFESASGTESLATDEARLWYDADRFDEQLVNAGAIYPDEALQTYLQQVLDGLYPDFKGAMRIRPFYSEEPNAFVLPNGSVYFDIGLLARVDNEAQLAAIIGHEGAHFVGRHSLKSIRTAKQHMSAVMIFEATTGVPVVGRVLAFSSMMGYSRDLEREADAIGFERLARAGYDVREAKVPFERLAREAAVMDYDHPVFFSSHPRMTERAENFRRMEASESAAGVTNRDLYQARTYRAVGDALSADLGARNARVIIFLLEQEGLLEGYPPEYRHFLAEAYRLRGREGDLARAEAEYLKTMSTCPTHAPPHGALGLIRMKQGRDAEACELFARYLSLDPEAPDKAYIESYLARLQEERP